MDKIIKEDGEVSTSGSSTSGVDIQDAPLFCKKKRQIKSFKELNTSSEEIWQRKQ